MLTGFLFIVRLICPLIFYSQCQQLHPQSLTNCMQVTAVMLTCSTWVTAGHQLLVSVLRTKEAEEGVRLGILLGECLKYSITSKYHKSPESQQHKWVWSCPRLCSWCHQSGLTLLQKDPELVFRGGRNGRSSRFCLWDTDKDLWIYRSGIMG